MRSIRSSRCATRIILGLRGRERSSVAGRDAHRGGCFSKSSPTRHASRGPAPPCNTCWGKPVSAFSWPTCARPHPTTPICTKDCPPGPIANPGEAALAAALKPQEHNYLFFVAKQDGSGGHTFSESYKEHLKAQKKIRRQMAQWAPAEVTSVTGSGF